MKKRTKHIVAGIVCALLLLAAAPLLIYVPPIQQWVVREVAAIASSKTGMDISVGHVSLRFPLDLQLDDVTVVQQGDTVADIRQAVVDVQLLPLLKQQVVLNRLEVNDARINTLDLISDTQIVGRMGTLAVSPSQADWSRGDVSLSEALLRDADVKVLLSDTATVDTTSTPVDWRIALGQCTLENVSCAVSLPGDTTTVSIAVDKAVATRGDLDLANSRYAVGTLDWQGGTFAYDGNVRPRALAGLDYDHVSLSDIRLAVDSILYEDPVTRLNIRSAAMKDQSGLEISELHGPLTFDERGVRAPGLTLKTPHSTVYAKADVDYSVADSVGAGQMHLDLDATVGREDLQAVLADRLPRQWPSWPLTVKGRVDGNIDEARIDGLLIDLPTVLHAEASGTASHLTDTDRLLADLDMKVSAPDADMLLSAAGLSTADVKLPKGLSMEGTVKAEGPRYTADVALRQKSNEARLKGYYDTKADAYAADADIRRWTLQQGEVAKDLGRLDLEKTQFKVKGSGTDFLSKKTWLEGEGSIGHLEYGDYHIDNAHVMTTLNNGRAKADVSMQNALIDGSFCLEATLEKNHDIQVSTHIVQADMYALGLADRQLQMGLTGDFKVSTDLDKNHKLSGLIKDIYLRDSVNTFHPEALGILLTARPDTTYARLQNGNFIVKMDASGPYDRLFSQLTALADTIKSQNRQRTINQPMLKQMLPTMRLYVTSGNKNTLADILKASQNIEFHDLLVDLTASPEKGVNGQAHLYGLNADSTRIDTVRVTLKDSDHGLTYQAQVTNNRKNPQFVFNALLDGHLYEHGLKAGLRFFDRDGRMGLRLGATATMEEGGVRFTLMPNRPTIGYELFTLNDDNYLFLRNDLKLQANIDLKADDGARILVYSEQQDSTLLQDFTVSVNQVDLDKLTSALPYVPRLSGSLQGDYHLMMDRKKQISVASDMSIRQMAYEGSPMGDLSAEFVYLQREDDTHAIDGYLMRDGQSIASFTGNYRNKKVTDGNEHLEGTVTLERTPLMLVNGFIPDQLLGLEGYANGTLDINGSLSQPNINGTVTLDSAYLVSQPYGMRMRFGDTPVSISQSKLVLDNFQLFAYNENPLSITGNIDFSNTSHATADLRMRANDFQLINAKQTARSLAFGKAFVNFLAVVRGPLDQLKMRGKLDVLGSTDLNYLLLDSPLSTDNQMDELVKFTDFNDSTQTVVQRPAPSGLDMDLSISIDQGAHLKCGLNPDQTNYIDLFGGGDLRMRYSDSDDLQLTGRYTLNSGQMKYSLPIIPLKTFTIQDGSYVEFTGDPMNPTLNITATERTKATVGMEGEQTRSVAFDCGVVITKTLNDMGLQFIISAPEDMSVSSELNAMAAEQRGKLAVTMLTTGMYLADGNTSGFSMNSALSSFLQGEINNITGNALKTVDLSIGLDNTTDASGQMHTDYSFKFAKRFWNNRLKVQIGGKVSSGSEMQGQNQSFFDNVTMEYRLSPTSNQYVKLFYNQNVYDWLEGYTGEYGGGFIWKRKLDHWWEIFGVSSNTNSKQP